MSAALEVSGLRISVPGPAGPVPIVHGIGFDLAPGRVTGLAGESGSGKSMTALALMGLLPAGATATADVARLGDEALLSLPKRRWRELRGRRMTMVFQDPATALDPVFTVGRQLRSVLRHAGQGTAKQRALEALARVGFRDPQAVHDAYPHELSGGMRQLVMIAMAGAVRPRVLLADEPTTALDVTTQAQVVRGIRDLADTHGVAVLLISHDLRVLAQCAGRIMVMEDGKLVESGSPGTLFTRPREAYTRRLVASIPRLHPAPAATPANASPPLLEVDNLTVRYRARGRNAALQAVDGVSFAIRPGETLGLAGESGSGKSTLARAVLGLLPASAGEVRLGGDPVPPVPAPASARRRIQMVFQDPAAALSPRRSVAQALAEPLAHFGIGTPADRRERMAEALDAVGLDAGVLRRRPHQLSSGQRQRVAIARALVCEPDLLVADEAVSALDVTVQAKVLELLATLRRERGIAMLFISHDLAVVRQLADTVGVMFHGRMVEQGPADRLFNAPAHPYTRELLDAVPSLDPGHGLAVPGARAGLGRAPAAGCVFQMRCPRAAERCRRIAPMPRPAAAVPQDHLGDPQDDHGAVHRLECHFPLTDDPDDDDAV